MFYYSHFYESKTKWKIDKDYTKFCASKNAWFNRNYLFNLAQKYCRNLWLLKILFANTQIFFLSCLNDGVFLHLGYFTKGCSFARNDSIFKKVGGNLTRFGGIFGRGISQWSVLTPIHIIHKLPEVISGLILKIQFYLTRYVLISCNNVKSHLSFTDLKKKYKINTI